MKLWGGRFEGQTDELMWQFNASIAFDRRLYAADVRGSVAYAQALARASLITDAERDALVEGLDAVLAEFEAGTFAFEPGDEDIHTAVERRLGELAGPVAGKLHTGRSRNDQVATDVRLYLLDEIAVLGELLHDLQAAVVDKAAAHLEAIMPGYTHLQPAQPVRFSHWLLSYFWALQRDADRLAGVVQRTAVLPLGAAALAGHALGIDRSFLAAQLGFPAPSQNSMDAVSDRDYLVEFLAWAALLQTHLSQLAEDLIVWSSPAYGFVEVADAYATGSSLMPQKKNPDALELLRGKTGRTTGALVSLLTTLKGLPSTYNKDLQEDKEPVFDVVDNLKLALPVAAGAIRTVGVRADRMRAALEADDTMLATDLADYLVRKSIPFRQSHGLVGQAVRQAEATGVSLREMPLAAYQAISTAFEPDLYEALDFEAAVERRDAVGGTARPAVERQLAQARAKLTEP
ncbi:MAG: argininosuccinate lyase [Anaerolineae bacterium]|nr:MAG: argininosuccinate lyase [Anaerolineae bacterium]